MAMQCKAGYEALFWLVLGTSTVQEHLRILDMEVR